MHLHDGDCGGAADGGKAMSNHDGGAAGHAARQRLLHQALALRVKSACCLLTQTPSDRAEPVFVLFAQNSSLCSWLCVLSGGTFIGLEKESKHARSPCMADQTGSLMVNHAGENWH